MNIVSEALASARLDGETQVLGTPTELVLAGVQPWHIECSDVLAYLATLPDKCLHCVVTSPPYFSLRDYAVDNWTGGDPACDHVEREIRTRVNLAEWSAEHAAGGGHAVPGGVQYRGVCGKCGAQRGWSGGDPTHQHDTVPARPRGGTGTPSKQTPNSQPGLVPVAQCSCGAIRIDNQIGLEPTPEEYVQTLVKVFGELRRVLRDDGVFYLNLGDSFWGSWGNAGSRPELDGKEGEQRPKGSDYIQRGGWDERRERPASSFKHNNLKPLDLCGIPHRVAQALQADGWYWRSTWHWVKKSPMPTSVSGWRWEKHKVKVAKIERDKGGYAGSPSGEHAAVAPHGGGFLPRTKWADCPGCVKCQANGGFILRKGAWRPTESVEYVFQFAKTPLYYCDAAAVRTAPALATVERDKHSRIQDKPAEQYAARHDHETKCVGGANRRNVLHLGPEPLSIGLCKFCQTYYPNVNKIKQRVTPGKPKKPICPNCKGADFVSHYAAFPTRLIEPLIKAATPEVGVCSQCGAPWARITQSPPNGGGWEKDAGLGRERGILHQTSRAHCADNSREVQTLGWRATCACNADTIPAIVFDPFMGAGTTALVAKRLGRRVLGCDLSQDYCTMASERVSRDVNQARRKTKPAATPGLVTHQADLFAELERR